MEWQRSRWPSSEPDASPPRRVSAPDNGGHENADRTLVSSCSISCQDLPRCSANLPHGLAVCSMVFSRAASVSRRLATSLLPPYAYSPPAHSVQFKSRVFPRKRLYVHVPICCLGIESDHLRLVRSEPACPKHVRRQNPVYSSLPAEGASADQAKEPKLEHFDPNLVDKSLDPCNDFYKYACSKWLAANPIPADQVYWSTGSGLQFWNENLLRETLEGASSNDSERSAVQQKIGDYWAACMDEAGIEAAGLKPLQPELDRIAALKSKKDIYSRDRSPPPSCFPERGRRRQPDRSAPFFGFNRTAGLRQRVHGGGADRPGGAQPCPTATTTSRPTTSRKSCCANTAPTSRRCWSWPANQKRQAAADAGRVIEIETATGARRRWTTSRAATPRTSTTR